MSPQFLPVPLISSWSLFQVEKKKFNFNIQPSTAALSEKKVSYETDLRRLFGVAHTACALLTLKLFPHFKLFERCFPHLFGSFHICSKDIPNGSTRCGWCPPEKHNGHPKCKVTPSLTRLWWPICPVMIAVVQGRQWCPNSALTYYTLLHMSWLQSWWLKLHLTYITTHITIIMPFLHARSMDVTKRWSKRICKTLQGEQVV